MAVEVERRRCTETDFGDMEKVLFTLLWRKGRLGRLAHRVLAPGTRLGTGYASYAVCPSYSAPVRGRKDPMDRLRSMHAGLEYGAASMCESLRDWLARLFALRAVLASVCRRFCWVGKIRLQRKGDPVVRRSVQSNHGLLVSRHLCAAPLRNQRSDRPAPLFVRKGLHVGLGHLLHQPSAPFKL